MYVRVRRQGLPGLVCCLPFLLCILVEHGDAQALALSPHCWEAGAHTVAAPCDSLASVLVAPGGMKGLKE